MRKHLVVEKVVCKKDRFFKLNTPLSVFFILLFANKILISQIELNNFGKYFEIPNSSGLHDIISYDVDKDGNIDIAGIDPTNKKVIIYYGKGSNKFSEGVPYHFSKNIEKIIPFQQFQNSFTNLGILYKSSGKLEFYIFNKRELTLSNSYNVGYFPDKLNNVSFYQDKFQALFVYGKNFPGITIFSFDSTGFQVKRIDTSRTFSVVKLAKINSDRYPEILALDFSSNKINYYFNRGNLNYQKATEKKFNFSISDFEIYDIDEDGISEILCFLPYEKHIEIIKISSSGEFSFSSQDKFLYKPDQIIFSDVTKDNLKDILYYDKTLNCIFLKVLNENKKFSSEIPVHRSFNFLTGINIYRSIQQNGIIFSFFGENIKIITNSRIKDEMDIYSLAAMPTAVKTIEDKKSMFQYRIWLENFNNTLVILKENEFGMPQSYHQIRLSKKFTDYQIFYKRQNSFELIAYDANGFNIEYIKTTLVKDEIIRKFLSLKDKIIQIRLNNDTSEDNSQIAVLSRSNNNLNLKIMNPLGINQLQRDYPLNSNNIYDFVFVRSPEPYMYYWKKNGKNKIEFYENMIYQNNTDISENLICSVEIDSLSFLKIFPFRTKSALNLFSVIFSKKKGYSVSSVLLKNKKIKTYISRHNIRIPENSLMWQASGSNSLQNRICFYDTNKRRIVSLMFKDNKGNIEISELLSVNKLNSFAFNSEQKEKFSILYTLENDPLIYKKSIK